MSSVFYEEPEAKLASRCEGRRLLRRCRTRHESSCRTALPHTHFSSPAGQGMEMLTLLSAFLGASSRPVSEQQDPAPILSVPQSHRKSRRQNSSTSSCSLLNAS